MLKALEKDRDRRYETPKDLAADIERFLSDKPVQAVPPSQLYLARKYFRRHRLAILTAAAIFAMSILATAVSSWQAIRATEAMRVAVLAKSEQIRLRGLAEESEAAEKQLRRTAQTMELQARQMAYASDMNLAKRMVAEYGLGRASELLERSRPRSGQLDVRGWEWRYLWQACKPDYHSDLCDLEHSIYSLSPSYDGKWAAIGGWESGGVTVWDLQTHEPIKSWPSTEQRSLVAFSPVEAILAFSTITTTADRTEAHVVLWDFAAKCEVKKLPLEGRCLGLKFAGDGRSLVTASANPREVLGASGMNVAMADYQGQICVWQIPDGEPLSAHPAYFLAVKEAIPFAATNDLSLAVYGYLQDIYLIDLATGEVLWTKRVTESNSVIALQFSPGGEMLASSGGFLDSSILLWESRSGKKIRRLEGHSDWVGDLVFWPDGKTLASSSRDHGRETIKNLNTTQIHRIAISPDNKILAVATGLGITKLFDMPGLDEIAEFPGGGLAMSFSPDGNRLAGEGLKLWDVKGRQKLLTLDCDAPPQCEFSPDGNFLVARTWQGILNIWQAPHWSEIESKELD